MVGVHLFISRSIVGFLEHFFQKLHKLDLGDLLGGFSSRILEPAVLPPGVDLFLQGDDAAG
jgi:hypothetical protein